MTNDLFRDAVNQMSFHLQQDTREWMMAHLLSYTFVGDEFVPNPDFRYPVEPMPAKRILS